jgi:pilus assembly protein CpaE
MRILVVSRSSAALEELRRALAGCNGFECEWRLVGNGGVDPLAGLRIPPDALVLRFDATHLAELEALSRTDPAARPPVVLIGPMGEVDVTRLAVRCGARDFLPEPLVAGDLVAALERLREERPLHGHADGSGVTVFVGAAGGVGTSLVAANVAHRLALDGDGTVLLDLDLIRAPLAGLFDLTPRLGLLDALTNADSLDAQAIEGYAVRHASGLLVIGAMPRSFVAERDVPETAMPVLLHRLASAFKHVIVDAGASLGTLGVAAVKRASRVYLVTQQSVPQVRGAARTYRVLIDELGVPASAIRVIVNRRSRGGSIGTDDLERAIGCAPVLVLPNDFRLVRESIDTGVPLHDVNRAAALTCEIGTLAERIRGHAAPAARASLLSRALPMFGRRLP